MGRSFEKSLAWQKRAKAALVGGGQTHKQEPTTETCYDCRCERRTFLGCRWQRLYRLSDGLWTHDPWAMPIRL